MASTRSGYLAVIKEAVAGTALQPTNFLHYKDGDLGTNLEVIVNNPIQATRWGGITAVAGKQDTAGNFNMDLDYDEAGFWLGAAMSFPGTPTDNSDATFTHQFDTDDTLSALTIEQGKGDITGDAYEVNRAFGAYIDTFELTASDGIVSFSTTLKSLGMLQRSRMLEDETAGSSVVIELESVEGFDAANDSVYISDTAGNETVAIDAITPGDKTMTIATLANSYTTAASAKVELAPQTPSFAAQKLFSFDMVSFQFGTNLTTAASATPENVEDWTFTYNNNIEERYGSLRKTPSVVAPKSASAQLKFKKYFENRTDRDNYLNATRKACIITVKDDNTIIGSGTQNPELVISVSDLRYTAYALPTGTDELYVAEVEGECFYDATDSRAVRVELTTTVADFTA